KWMRIVKDSAECGVALVVVNFQGALLFCQADVHEAQVLQPTRVVCQRAECLPADLKRMNYSLRKGLTGSACPLPDVGPNVEDGPNGEPAERLEDEHLAVADWIVVEVVIGR